MEAVVETAPEVIVSVKGQIVIPAAVRQALGIVEGTRVRVEIDESNESIVLTPITANLIRSLRGKYKGKGLLKALAEDRRREREL
jgi:AbrB family looped-hinge helix DNA binding protein